MTILVTGSTGNTGGVAARTLLERGLPVRIMVRDAAKAASLRQLGAEVVSGELGDSKALAAAMRGVKSAYVLVPPNLAVDDFRGYQRSVSQSIVAAVREAAPKELVLLSSVGAQLSSGTGPILALHELEGELKASGVSASFLRPGYFMENLKSSFGALADGILPSFSPADTPFQMVATRDIGLLAADLLQHGRGAPGRPAIVELSGPVAYSMNDVANALSSQLGRAIKVHEAPVSAMSQTLQSFGFKRQLADLYQEMTAAFNNNAVPFETTTVTRGATTLQAALKTFL